MTGSSGTMAQLTREPREGSRNEGRKQNQLQFLHSAKSRYICLFWLPTCWIKRDLVFMTELWSLDEYIYNHWAVSDKPLSHLLCVVGSYHRCKFICPRPPLPCSHLSLDMYVCSPITFLWAACCSPSRPMPFIFHGLFLHRKTPAKERKIRPPKRPACSIWSELWKNLPSWCEKGTRKSTEAPQG